MAGFPTILHTEECMRDGLQIESPDIPTKDKVRLLDALSETGLKEIAVGSFASPKWTPQMADIDGIIGSFSPKPGVRYTYSAYNDRGRERARSFTPPLSMRLREYQLGYTMCDVFQQRNVNRTQAQQVAGWPKQIEKAKAAGIPEGGIHLTAAFGSNWTGPFSLSQRMDALERMHHAWEEAGIAVARVGLSDAMSWATPYEMEQQIAAIRKRWPHIKDFSLHLHNGRGMALASFYAALRLLGEEDTLRVQSSIGGMAGCPYCGNGQAAMMIATEDLMHMLESMGIETGIDIYKLIEVVWLAEKIVGHQLYGFVSKCGPMPGQHRLYAMDMPRVETLAQAQHFLRGPAAYAGAPSPWKGPIRSYQRSDSLPESFDEDRHPVAEGRT